MDRVACTDAARAIQEYDDWGRLNAVLYGWADRYGPLYQIP